MSSEPNTSYYEDPDEGVSALEECSVIESLREGTADRLHDRSLDVIEKRSTRPYDTRAWGSLYLIEDKRCFCFLRHAPKAKTEWLYLMFGAWQRDDATQRSEANRRFENSQLM
jgi:hypothetical protein